MSMDMEEQYDKIYRYCYFRLRNQQTAEDITQETFLRYLEKYQGNTVEQALKCLYTIARNLCIDEYRRCSKERSFEFETKSTSNDEAVNDSMQDTFMQKSLIQENAEEHLLTSLAVRKAVEALEQDEQELLLLRYVNEVPVQTIGHLLGISRFAVYRRLMMVTKKFREELGKEGF